jgi:hypothetical protein
MPLVMARSRPTDGTSCANCDAIAAVSNDLRQK